MIPATTNYLNALNGFRAGAIQLLIEIDGYSRAFTNYNSGIAGQYPWIIDHDTIAISINDLDGGADQITTDFTVLDSANRITADFPNFVFEGKKCTIKAGFAGLSQSDFITIATLYVDNVQSVNGNTAYQFNLVDITAQLAKVVYATGDDGVKETSSSNLKTLNGHPLDILFDILQNEIGLDDSLIDIDKITAYRDGPFSGLQFLFHLSQAPAGADFIDNQILKPLGGYRWINSQGQVTVNFFYPLAGPVPVFTLGPDTWTSIPEAEQTDMVNTVQMQFDKDDADSNASGNYLAQDTETFAPSTSLYGQYGELVIQADGVRSAFQGFDISKLTSRMVFLRYGLKNLKFDSDAADAIWIALRLESGDITAVTHPQIPDRKAGVMGITNKLFEILNKTIDPIQGLVTLTMIDASYLSTFGLFFIAPTGQADFTDSSADDRATYMFLCGDDDKYSDGSPANTLG